MHRPECTYAQTYSHQYSLSLSNYRRRCCASSCGTVGPLPAADPIALHFQRFTRLPHQSPHGPLQCSPNHDSVAKHVEGHN